jgi:hypothetical protein
MKKRVSLTIDTDVLKLAKQYVDNNGKSLSAVVEEYLRKLSSGIHQKNIIDLVEELEPSGIEPGIDLIELYYEERYAKFNSLDNSSYELHRIFL